MKITSISVHDEGQPNIRRLHISAEMQSNERLEPDDIARLENVLREFGESQGPCKATDTPPESPTEGRRSRRSSPAAASGETAAASSAASEPSENPTEGRRRRRGAEAAPSASETSAPATATPAEPTSGSVRRRRAAIEEAAAAPAASPTEGRRRRSASATDTPSSNATGSATSPSEITDADLSKAASEGARNLTPKRVEKILEEFKVAKLQDLRDGQRRRFIEIIAAEIEEADKPVVAETSRRRRG